MEAFPTLTPVSVLAARRERQAALDLFLSEDEACVSFLKQIEAYWTATWFTEPPPFYEMFEEPYTLAVLMRVKPTLEAAGYRVHIRYIAGEPVEYEVYIPRTVKLW